MLSSSDMTGHLEPHTKTRFLRIFSDHASQVLANKTMHKILLLTHWSRVTHICVGNLTTIGSENGLSPGRRQAITWTNVGI